MSDLSIGSMIDQIGLTKVRGLAGETVTAGQAVYRKAADGKWWKAKADALGTSGTVGTPGTVGIIIVGGSANDTVTVATGGDLDVGVAVAKGTIYVVAADTAGGIAPWADLGTGNFVTILGVGNVSTMISLCPFPSGVAHV